MSLRFRATMSAVAFGLGLLMIVGGSVDKSSERIRYARALELHKPDPAPPSTFAGNFFMILGVIATLGGAVGIGFAFRDLTRDIQQAQSRAETAMRMEVASKPPPKPK